MFRVDHANNLTRFDLFGFFFLAKCIDKYIALRNQGHEDPQNVEPMDPRLKDVVEKMFDRCYQDGEYKQVCRL